MKGDLVLIVNTRKVKEKTIVLSVICFEDEKVRDGKELIDDVTFDVRLLWELL